MSFSRVIRSPRLHAGVTTEELRALNQIEGSTIYAKEIYIPSYGQVPSAEVESSSTDLSFEPTALIDLKVHQ